MFDAVALGLMALSQGVLDRAEKSPVQDLRRPNKRSGCQLNQ